MSTEMRQFIADRAAEPLVVLIRRLSDYFGIPEAAAVEMIRQYVRGAA